VNSILEIVELGFEAFALSYHFQSQPSLPLMSLVGERFPTNPFSIIFINNWSTQSQKLKLKFNEK
jgi:hypothetical protein